MSWSVESQEAGGVERLASGFPLAVEPAFEVQQSVLRWTSGTSERRALVARETGPSSPVAAKPRFLDRVRAELRLRHYSRRTEQAYVHWIRRHIPFHGKRHPETMGAPEATSFLTALAVQGGVAASTQSQAPVLVPQRDAPQQLEESATHRISQTCRNPGTTPASDSEALWFRDRTGPGRRRVVGFATEAHCGRVDMADRAKSSYADRQRRHGQD